MKLLIDDAHIETIRQIYRYFPCAGVTTNPSILLQVNRPPYEVLREIREFIGPDAELHVQVVSERAEDMAAEGRHICEVLGKKTLIKIPVNREGLRAVRLLSREGVSVTATAVYAQMQAYLAAEAGAVYAAPYVNRIDNLGADGVGVTKDIHDIFQKNGLKTEVLAASFRNTQQVLELVKYGVGAATVSPAVIEGFLKLDAVDSAVGRFRQEFFQLCGEGKTML